MNNCPHCSAIPAPLESPPLVQPTQTIETEHLIVFNYEIPGVELQSNLTTHGAPTLEATNTQLSSTESDHLSTTESDSDPESERTPAEIEFSKFQPPFSALKHIGFDDPLIKSTVFTTRKGGPSLKRKLNGSPVDSEGEKRGKFIH